MQQGWNRRGIGPGGLAALALALALALAAPARAEDTQAKPAPPPDVPLDRLLKLPPPSAETATERIGNASKSEWRARFASARAEREAAQKALEDAQTKLGDAVGESDPWQMAPPGASTGNATDAPANYQLRQEVRRQREELARSEKHLQELTIQADLAGVPGDWRE